MRTDYPGSESSRELSFSGAKVPGNFCSRERKFSVGTFAPRSENTEERKVLIPISRLMHVARSTDFCTGEQSTSSAVWSTDLTNRSNAYNIYIYITTTWTLFSSIFIYELSNFIKCIFSNNCQIQKPHYNGYWVLTVISILILTLTQPYNNNFSDVWNKTATSHTDVVWRYVWRVS